ncbi:hypothetical protein DFH27DRAFT_512230 [Peziza echinospora]|nr:hypothetical protein DFH27DRAFT_512230 [Peziza echinospora]
MARVRKNPRIRKAPAEKVERPKVPKLERPLSQLTDEYNHLPIRDMESWVNRPASVRKEEVDKRGGYITRPMNSFMLYRSAYAERTKLWCLQNNHQVVSSVSGESWPLEPDAVRARYNELARIERINHQSAHPGYKFSPSKTQTSRKRKGAKADEQSDESDVEDMVNDAEYVESPNEKRRRSQRNLKKEEKGQDFEPGAIAVNNKYYDLLVAGEGGASRSSFAATNPGKTPPVCMGSTDMTGQYYQTTVQASRATPVPNGNAIIEDVTIQKTLAPGRSSNLGLSQMWMTSGMYASSLGWNPEEVEDAMHENCKVDPMLLVQDMGDGHYGSYDNQPGVYTLPDDIDEGFEMGGFDIDPLFQTDCHNVFEGYPPQMNGGANCGDHGGYGPSSIDSAIDVQSMSAYQDTIRGYIDGDDAWTIVKDESCGAGLKYDEWLQE